jgi:hypothetical protein
MTTTQTNWTTAPPHCPTTSPPPATWTTRPGPRPSPPHHCTGWCPPPTVNNPTAPGPSWTPPEPTSLWRTRLPTAAALTAADGSWCHLTPNAHTLWLDHADNLLHALPL